jgi:hypothetical protein
LAWAQNTVATLPQTRATSRHFPALLPEVLAQISTRRGARMPLINKPLLP